MTVLLSSLGVLLHYSDIIMSAMASQIISLSTVCLGTDQIKHQSSVSLDFVRGFHRSPVNSPHKGPVTRKIFPLDDVIMLNESVNCQPILWASTKPMITVYDNMNNEQLKHLFYLSEELGHSFEIFSRLMESHHRNPRVFMSVLLH